jgi:hypothetical protein
MHTPANCRLLFSSKETRSSAWPPSDNCPPTAGGEDIEAVATTGAGAGFTLSSRRTRPWKFTSYGLLWRLPLVGVALLLSLASLPQSAAAQPLFPGAPDEPNVDLRVYPPAFWGPRAGPGVGVGVVGHNLARQNDQWLLTAAPARYEQVATASFASANPQQAHRYVLVDTRALHTDRDWLGPSSRRTVLQRTDVRARVRTGQVFLNQKLLLQPQLTVSHHYVDAVRQPATPSNIGAATLPAPGSQHTGLRAGLDLQFDTRNRPVLTTRGVLLQGTWDRYLPLDGATLQFDQIDLDAYGYVPLGGLHRFATRVSVTLTRSRDKTPVPVYMRPTLDGTVVPGWGRGRFVDSDRLLGSVLYRFPLLYYKHLVAIEGHVGAHAATVYDNIGNQFAPSFSFENNLSLDASDRPFRPSASVGLRFAVPFRARTTLDLALGLSPEGVTGMQFSFARSLQTVRSPHHTTRTLR